MPPQDDILHKGFGPGFGSDEDWPASRFLELLRIWTDLDPHEPLSIRNIKPHVDAVNTLLGLPEGSPASFIHTSGEVPVTPVPFIFQGDAGQVRLAILGLNPKAGDRLTVAEKRMTRELSPAAYARFYTSDEWLPHALSSPYYWNLGTILLSLERGCLVKFSDYRRSGHNSDRTSAFAGIVSGQGVLEMRLIPFYSQAWRPAGARGLAKLLSHPRYGCYYEKLTTLVEDVLQPEGWIMANGRDPAELLPQLLAARDPLVRVGPEDTALPYTFYRWKKWRVVCLRQFLRSKGGRLNTNEDLARLFEDIYRAFGQ